MEFGDRVSFTHHYRRFLGKRQVWPRGDRSRYVHPIGYSVELRERHPDSTLPDDGPRHHRLGHYPVTMTPATWERVPVSLRMGETVHMNGVFGGTVLKAEGWAGNVWDEGFGHSWKHHAYVPLAEVMVRSVGKPLMYVVHLDDLAAES